MRKNFNFEYEEARKGIKSNSYLGNWFLYSGTGNKFLVYHDVHKRFDFSYLPIRKNPIYDQFKRNSTSKLMEYDQDSLLIFQEWRIQCEANFFMRVIERDGTESNMCGNGIIVLARHFIERCGYSRQKIFRVKTQGGVCKVKAIRKNWYEVNMGKVSCGLSSPNEYCNHELINKNGALKYLNQYFISKELKTCCKIISLCDIGLEPHLVVEVNNKRILKNFEILRGVAEKILQRKDLFPIGLSINFTLVHYEKSVPKICSVTYERGVNDFTKSCGTGSVCSAYSFWQTYNRNSSNQDEIVITTKGGLHTVENIRGNYLLKGQATLVKILR